MAGIETVTSHLNPNVRPCVNEVAPLCQKLTLPRTINVNLNLTIFLNSQALDPFDALLKGTDTNTESSSKDASATVNIDDDDDTNAEQGTETAAGED